jgi:ribonuclease P protein subunit RPR2
LVAVTGRNAWQAATAHPAAFAGFTALTIALQLFAGLYGRGSISVAGIGMLATGFTFGVGPACVVALLAGTIHSARIRPPVHRGVFTAANFVLATAGGVTLFRLLTGDGSGALQLLVAAFAAGVVFWALNIGLLAYAMSLSEGISTAAVWRERFRWLTAHYVAFGPLALASSVAFERDGVAGLIAFLLPPALLIVSTRQYVRRTQASVEQVRLANEELRLANAQLAERNDDLHELFQFSSGLAARATDRDALVSYAEGSLQRLARAPVRVNLAETAEGEVELFAGGTRVGALELGDGAVREQWKRLRETLVPQLATAIESAELVEEVRRTHLATIAALSRSMEAKDYYTGGHTERVASIAVGLARRLGFEGADLQAVEIGALLHDIGKIGIPERILHKPGPLDDDEWEVMKEHPVISDYILSDVGLSPIVRQIARSSHERIDGTGYPDGLAGEEIPLAARIVLVADALDALTSDRPYRPARHIVAALREVREHAGTQFCPVVVAALDQLYREEPELLAGKGLKAVKVA